MPGFAACTACGAELVESEPENEGAGPVSFLELARSREDRDRFVVLWEGDTDESAGLIRRLEAALIPLEISRDSGRTRIEVPWSYAEEARVIAAQPDDEPDEAPQADWFVAEPIDLESRRSASWAWVIVLVAVALVVLLLLSSR